MVNSSNWAGTVLAPKTTATTASTHYFWRTVRRRTAPAPHAMVMATWVPAPTTTADFAKHVRLLREAVGRHRSWLKQRCPFPNAYSCMLMTMPTKQSRYLITGSATATHGCLNSTRTLSRMSAFGGHPNNALQGYVRCKPQVLNLFVLNPIQNFVAQFERLTDTVIPHL